MQLRGVRPFFSDKFDIAKHGRYKELSDYDQNNTFDIEDYVKHLQHMKVILNTEVGDAFDCGVFDFTTKGNKLLKTTLVNCAHVAVKVKGSYFSAQFARISAQGEKEGICGSSTFHIDSGIPYIKRRCGL